ncbi:MULTISPECIES: hypothetical protein [Pseudomonas syringae group]|uniref:Uncharacterized protein n=1 Tax=Pseudomonas syringae pv. coriandricola TaxID=264453 RepID=A0A3M3JCB6_9PSED|nr:MULTISPECIES: hypothetical protein [Pseudomonas syringae group]RMN08418.1 hypothetical protein ALQ65_200274 [Pseudomonas syringae pv. coriandricola]
MMINNGPHGKAQIDVQQMEAGLMQDSSTSEERMPGDWYEWYTYAAWASFEHCLFLAVVEQCGYLYTDFRELHSTLFEIDLAPKPGQGLIFDRKAFLDHLVKYRSATGWFGDEGQARLPYPDELVREGREPLEYLGRFLVAKF